MSIGQIERVGTTDGYFTQNQKYGIVAVGVQGPGADVGVFLVIADQGSFYGVASSNPDFDLVEFYSPTKVV